MQKVKLPKWWTEVDHEVIGYTDGIITYCCSSAPCFFVTVPEFEYEGYFNTHDLRKV